MNIQKTRELLVTQTGVALESLPEDEETLADLCAEAGINPVENEPSDENEERTHSTD